MQTLLGKKIAQTQVFLANGTRLPVTKIEVSDTPVTQVKTYDTDRYTAVQLGFGSKKRASKALEGHSKKAKLEKVPAFFYEVKVDREKDELPALGDLIKPGDVLKPGDIVKVTGISKGKGFAGGVKRYHFKGGPRTHGQSDRERAPGSIGQTTTPGRVYRGKRMAGHMGVDKVTVKNLSVIEVSPTEILVKGLVPGGKNTLVLLQKTGEDKKFVALYKEKETVETEPAAQEQPAVEEQSSKEEVKTDSHDGAASVAQSADSGPASHSLSEASEPKEEK